MRDHKKSQQVIVEFFAQLPPELSDLTYKQVNEIVRAPWKFLKRLMRNGDFEPVRFKYLGLFQVRLKRAQFMLMKKREKFEEGKLAPELYFPAKKNLEKIHRKPCGLQRSGPLQNT
jgi:hypothetical protein